MADTETSHLLLPENFGDALAALRAGELVVFPTETFYGIGADPMQPAALERLFAAKDREAHKPIALIASDAASAFAVAGVIPGEARLLADRFWPGPLTLVLPAREGLHQALIGPSGGVGVRVSSHPIARELARSTGGLITATSANLSGGPPARTLAEAHRFFAARIRVYLDAGPLASGAASTVLEFGKNGSLRIARAGVIDPAAITAILRRGI